MKHLFVPYEIAAMAKEKKFTEPCLAHYVGLEREFIVGPFNEHNIDYVTTAPLYQQLVDWFRDEHKIHIYIEQMDKWFYGIESIPFKSNFHNLEVYGKQDYYEALNEAIVEAFKLIDKPKPQDK